MLQEVAISLHRRLQGSLILKLRAYRRNGKRRTDTTLTFHLQKKKYNQEGIRPTAWSITELRTANVINFKRLCITEDKTALLVDGLFPWELRAFNVFFPHLTTFQKGLHITDFRVKIRILFFIRVLFQFYNSGKILTLLILKSDSLLTKSGIQSLPSQVFSCLFSLPRQGFAVSALSFKTL